MMPDLGAYAGEVLLAWGGGIALLIGLCIQSALRAHLAKRALREVEARRSKS